MVHTGETDDNRGHLGGRRAFPGDDQGPFESQTKIQLQIKETISSNPGSNLKFVKFKDLTHFSLIPQSHFFLTK